VTRAVLDSNVYLSAVLFGGNPRLIVELAQSGLIETIASGAIVAEVEETLRRKFDWSEMKIRAVGSATWRAAIQVVPRITVTDCIDPGDNRVLECAVAANVNFIVTGDRHLLDLNPYGRTAILTPRQFLDAAPWVPL